MAKHGERLPVEMTYEFHFPLDGARKVMEADLAEAHQAGYEAIRQVLETKRPRYVLVDFVGWWRYLTVRRAGMTPQP